MSAARFLLVDQKLTTLAQELVSAVLKEGDIVVDAVSGNGYDTIYCDRKLEAQVLSMLSTFRKNPPQLIVAYRH